MRLQALLATILLVSCAPDPGESVPGKEFWGGGSLGSSVTWEAEQLTVTLDDVTEDSRCPTDAQCVTAGTATAIVTLIKNGLPTETRTLTIPDPASERYFNYTITLLEVNPKPTTQHAPSKSEYALEVYVVKD